MGIRRTKHAVYDLKYHLVWIPKYRKNILDKEVSEYLKDIFSKVAKEYEFKIDTMEVTEGHVHIFVELSYNSSKHGSFVISMTIAYF